jgi:PleD family two-component response regulator
VPTEDITTFVKRADAAMYTSKDEGRNTVSCLFAD